MRRREFITLLGGVSATWPVVARAQQATRIFRIGFLGFGNGSTWANRVEALRGGLRDLGALSRLPVGRRCGRFDSQLRAARAVRVPVLREADVVRRGVDDGSGHGQGAGQIRPAAALVDGIGAASVAAAFYR